MYAKRLEPANEKRGAALILPLGQCFVVVRAFADGAGGECFADRTNRCCRQDKRATAWMRCGNGHKNERGENGLSVPTSVTKGMRRMGGRSRYALLFLFLKHPFGDVLAHDIIPWFCRVA